MLCGRRFGKQIAMVRIRGGSSELVSVVLMQKLVVIEEVVKFATLAAETGPNVRETCGDHNLLGCRIVL